MRHVDSYPNKLSVYSSSPELFGVVFETNNSIKIESQSNSNSFSDFLWPFLNAVKLSTQF